MKGFIFTSFLEMVEDRFSLNIMDRIIVDADLPSGGSYTSVGTYDHGEMIQLVVQLSKQTNIPVSDLVRVFGEYMFIRLSEQYPQFIHKDDSLFDFLRGVDGYIHVEVRKLHHDAELPRFEYESPDPDTLVMLYRSSRPFADLAEGLIIGCIKHYGTAIDLRREDAIDEQGAATRFILKKLG